VAGKAPPFDFDLDSPGNSPTRSFDNSTIFDTPPAEAASAADAAAAAGTGGLGSPLDQPLVRGPSAIPHCRVLAR
jgi:hypothetical protein